MAVAKAVKNSRGFNVTNRSVARNDLDHSLAPLGRLELGREVGLGVSDSFVLQRQDRHYPPPRAIWVRRAGDRREPLWAGQRQNRVPRSHHPTLLVAQDLGVRILGPRRRQPAGVV